MCAPIATFKHKLSFVLQPLRACFNQLGELRSVLQMRNRSSQLIAPLVVILGNIYAFGGTFISTITSCHMVATVAEILEPVFYYVGCHAHAK